MTRPPGEPATRQGVAVQLLNGYSHGVQLKSVEHTSTLAPPGGQGTVTAAILTEVIEAGAQKEGVSLNFSGTVRPCPPTQHARTLIALIPSTDTIIGSTFTILGFICKTYSFTTLRMQLQPGICPFSVLGFWGKMTMPSAGIMAYRRDLPSTTRI